MQAKEIEEFCKRWQSGDICLHVTDGLPGLSCRFDSLVELEKLSVLKHIIANNPARPTQSKSGERKGYICLFASADNVFRYCKTPTDRWSDMLRENWLPNLTVVCQVKDRYRASMGETLAARVINHLPRSKAWIGDILNRLGVPFPSTSINFHGEPPCLSNQEVAEWAKRAVYYSEKFQKKIKIYVPSYFYGVDAQQKIDTDSATAVQASTILELLPDGKGKILRQGVQSIDQICKTYQCELASGK